MFRVGSSLEFFLLLALYTQLPANLLDSMNVQFNSMGAVLKLLIQLAKVDFGKESRLAASSME